MGSKSSSQKPADELARAGKEFYRRGWVLGTSGNFSVLLARKPLRICITASGNEKGNL
jgi:methylthioribulose-1-phosphate dehydratase